MAAAGRGSSPGRRAGVHASGCRCPHQRAPVSTPPCRSPHLRARRCPYQPRGGDHGRVSSEFLRRRAQAVGVATSYRDWRGRTVEVADETIAAVLAALGAGPSGSAIPPAGSRPGPRRGPASGPGPASWPGLAADHPVAPRPLGRSWGFTVQLYSLRSRRSWGHGDFRDLADLAVWSASELGAGFLLINPLHAAEPVPPVSPSPYLPMSRRFISPLYLRVEDIPEYAHLPADGRRRIEELAAPLRAASGGGGLIDRDAVWRAKRAALEII